MGRATTRWPMASRSMVTLTASSFFSSFFSFFGFVGFFALLSSRFFVFFDLFFVALRLNRRLLALLQHGRINMAQNGMLKAGKVQPTRGQAQVGGGREDQLLAAFVEDGIAGIAERIGDLGDFVVFERVHKNG